DFVVQDPMSDRYFYKLPNGPSGVFVYEGANFTNVVTLPYRPYKIEKQVGSNRIEWFKITDDSGTIYKFEPYLSWGNRSEWFLKQITSADGTDVITYTYTDPTSTRSYYIPNHTY